MTKIKKSFLLVALGVVVIGIVVVVRVASFAPLQGSAEAAQRGELGYAWRGAIHVHSDVSDGASGIDEILAAAQTAGVDFLVVSDHNPFSQQRPRPGWYGDILLIVAEEISTEEGHLLALNVGGHRYRFGPTARQALADIDDAGGWALVAHPDHARQAWRGPWGGTAGLEIVNLADAWSRQPALPALMTVAASLIDADFAASRLLSERWPALATWDALSGLRTDGSVPRRRVAVGSADAHGPLVGSIPGYAETLSAVSTLVWIDTSPEESRGADAGRIEAALLAALRAGRASVEVTALGDARSFSFAAASPTDRALMGEFAPWERGPWRLAARIEAPVEAELVLLRDGAPVARGSGTLLEAEADTPGTYRVEVYRPDVATSTETGPPWLVSNSVYVWPAAARAAARIHRAPALPAPPLSRDLLAGAAFDNDHRDVLHNTVARAEGAWSWTFALAPDSNREAFAAMAWRPDPAMDWTDADGIVVDLRAAGPLRVSLEVRSTNDDGITESWAYSLKVDPERAAVAIPWHWFRRPWNEDLSDAENGAAKRPGAEDLGRVEGVFFIVTPAVLAPGSEAELELRALGLY
jgi:hypothetical protein